MSLKKRYRPLWIILHWLMALLVFAAFGIGLFSLVNTPNTDAKRLPLGIHLALGIAILVLVSARYILRIFVFAPARRDNSAPALSAKKKLLLDQLNVYVHPLLYLFTALMSLLGLAIAFPADLFNPAAPLPADFYVYPTRAWHGTVSLILLLLIVQHVLVAIFHQFIRGENYLGRMWFAPRR
jgi:cytochrome b561